MFPRFYNLLIIISFYFNYDMRDGSNNMTTEASSFFLNWTVAVKFGEENSRKET